MKKLLVSLLVVVGIAVMIAPPLAVAASDPVEIRVILFGPTPEKRAGMDAAIELFEAANPNIKVRVQEEPWDTGQQKIFSSIQAGNPPDAVINLGDWIGQFAAMGILEPLDDYIAKWPDRDRVVPSLWEAMTHMGHIYGLPVYTSTQVLYYNKAHFAEAGIDQPPTTHEEFLEAAKKLTRDGRWGFAIMGNDIQLPTMFMMMWDKDATYVKIDDQGNHSPNFNTPKTVEGYQFFVDLYRKYKVVPPTTLSDDWTGIRTNFAAGKISMVMRYSTDLMFYLDQLGDDLGIAPIFSGPERPYCWVSPFEGVVFKDSKHKQEAWEFLKFFAIGEGANANLSIAQYLPVDIELLERYKSRPGFDVFFETMEFAGAQPFYPEWGACYLEYQQIAQQALIGNLTPQQAIQQMEDTMNRHIVEIYSSR